MSIPDRQQAMLMSGPGAPVLAVERPVDQPGPGQVLVKVAASSLNFHDNVNLMGLIPGPLPRVPMSDGAGEVVALGPGSTNSKTGCASGSASWGRSTPGGSTGRRRPRPNGNCPATAATGGCSSTASPTPQAWSALPITSAIPKPRQFRAPR